MPGSNSDSWSQSSKNANSRWEQSSHNWKQNYGYDRYGSGYWNSSKYDDQWTETGWIDWKDEQYQKKWSDNGARWKPKRSKEIEDTKETKESDVEKEVTTTTSMLEEETTQMMEDEMAPVPENDLSLIHI